MHIFKEVQDTAEILRKSADFLNGTRVVTRIGFHDSSVNWNMLSTQPVVDGTHCGMIHTFYQPLLDLGLRADAIAPEEALDGYDLIFSPLMMTLEEAGLPERIAAWVKNGGTWVAGPFTDIRNIDGARYQHKPFGILEELTGARWLYGIPDRVGAVKTAWTENGAAFAGGRWYDIYEPQDGCTVVSVTDGHSALNGKACVLDIPVGRGHVILLGTFPGEDELREITKRACAHAGIPCGTVEGRVLVSPRAGDAGEGEIVMEYSGNKGGVYYFEGRRRDLLTGKEYEGSAPLAPYEILVLVRDAQR